MVKSNLGWSGIDHQLMERFLFSGKGIPVYTYLSDQAISKTQDLQQNYEKRLRESAFFYFQEKEYPFTRTCARHVAVRSDKSTVHVLFLYLAFSPLPRHR